MAALWNGSFISAYEIGFCHLLWSPMKTRKDDQIFGWINFAPFMKIDGIVLFTWSFTFEWWNWCNDKQDVRSTIFSAINLGHQSNFVWFVYVMSETTIPCFCLWLCDTKQMGLWFANNIHVRAILDNFCMIWMHLFRKVSLYTCMYFESSPLHCLIIDTFIILFSICRQTISMNERMNLIFTGHCWLKCACWESFAFCF